MTSIPRPIEYDELHHSGDIITKPLNLKLPADVKFIWHVLADPKKDNAEAYLVQLDNGKVKVCRKRLKPAITTHGERHNYFALKNSTGNIIKNGMNMRRPESIISVLRAMFRRNPVKLSLLARNHDLSVAERCDLFNYTLVKQSEPF